MICAISAFLALKTHNSPLFTTEVTEEKKKPSGLRSLSRLSPHRESLTEASYLDFIPILSFFISKQAPSHLSSLFSHLYFLISIFSSLNLSPTMNPLWGIDLGGTKIEGVVLASLYPLRVLARHRIATERQRGYAHILDRIVTLVAHLKQETGLAPETLGIGTPGTLDPQTQAIKNSNTTALNGQPLKQDLEARLGVPISMANDANCFALAETRLGAAYEVAPQAEVVFGIILGTGVGGGVVAHGKLIEGLHGLGGEWGHNFLDESGGEDYAGLHGCVETILSGPALERWYTRLSGVRRSLPDIVDRHLAGLDPHATATVQRLTHFFGKAVAPVINLIDPEVIVVGGGVGNIELLYTEGVAAVAPHVFNPVMHTRFLKPKLGDSAGVFGAAMLGEGV